MVFWIIRTTQVCDSSLTPRVASHSVISEKKYSVHKRQVMVTGSADLLSVWLWSSPPVISLLVCRRQVVTWDMPRPPPHPPLPTPLSHQCHTYGWRPTIVKMSSPTYLYRGISPAVGQSDVCCVASSQLPPSSWYPSLNQGNICVASELLFWCLL